ncbi:CBL-interacting protein kinase 23 isoform X4 [Cryptomeria japonica]|uniref:CBL-interacting protein kinase 23 isoform X4 n=1 Tax=Cryptomeria japonica TaxID=3369 RepID=UPI0027DAA52B|nr:CBL-interacting protein kinase 23 isoform X4 [Cryptomeria japonica]
MSRQRIRVGKYELGRLVGEGKFSKVKFARNMETGEGVAIKIMERDTLLKQKMVKQIKREISAMNLIKHPNIVRLHEEDGLLHTQCGTPNYVAPEVINDKGYDGATADLWSCGVILFYLMAGYLPFDDQNLMRLYKKSCKADFKYPLWFSSSAKKLISRILDPNPKTRITAPEILQNEWFQKDYIPPKFQEDEDVSLNDIDVVFSDSEEQLVTEIKEIQPVFMNAFELISMLQVLNFGNMFEQHMGLVNQQTRFTSKHPAKEIITKIDEAAGTLGFNVKKRNFKVKLQGANIGRKGRLSVVIELFEVAPSLCMVEVHKAGGDTLEFSEFYEKLSSALKDIIWKSKVNIGEIA